MAPIKSSLARSVSKLLGVYKDTDLSLRGSSTSSRFIAPPPVAASGGNIDGQPGGNGYTYHVFTGPGNFTVTQGGTIEILLVGGGGPSGSTQSSTTVGNCGGGGAGGIVHATAYPIESGTHPITVGDPAPQPLTPSPGRGVDSTFVDAGGPTTITALGGGGGSYYGVGGSPQPGGAGFPGGSGGGGGYPGQPGGTANQPSQNPGISGLLQYGNPGGQMSTPEGASNYDYGGGGGAGQAGFDGDGPATPSPNTSGHGGDGQPFSDFPGSLPAFGPLPSAWKTAVAPQGYFGGGGGGGVWNGAGNPNMPGGLGGGGNGGTSPQAGVTNTGGGAGGSPSPPGSSQPTGQKGGSGICIIRYSQ